MEAVRPAAHDRELGRAIVIPSLVLAALDPLDDEEREAVRQVLGELASRPAGAPADRLLRRLAGDEPLYVVHAAPRVRLIVRLTAERVEALDVVRPETLLHMFPAPTMTPD